VFAAGEPAHLGKMLSTPPDFSSPIDRNTPQEIALYVRWNGGGGSGDPLDRSPEKVTADLAASLISWDAASEIYGVAVQAGNIDRGATEAKRKSLRQARLVVGQEQ
jgi:N-methylhydantoinase B/oxoprolinase/acetone carboxylase alpha subunit